MSKHATAANVVSLDEFRRHRAGSDRRPAPIRALTSVPAMPAPVWFVWVPVWVW